MLSKVLLLTAAGTAIKGLFSLRQQKYFSRIFKDVEQMADFNVDYMKSEQDLPDKEYALVCGKLTSDKMIQLYSEDRQALFKSFYPTGDNNMWKTNRVDEFNFNFDSQDIKIKIVPPNRKDILLYNLPQFKKDISSSEVQQKFSLSKKVYTEYAIIPEKYFVIFGQVFQKEDHAIIKPLIISGENKEGFLDFLDGYLMKLHRQNQYWMGGCFGLLLVHAFVFRFLQRRENKEQKEQVKEQ